MSLSVQLPMSVFQLECSSLRLTRFVRPIRQRLLTRLFWLVDALLRVRRAGSDLNPNHLLVFTVPCTMKSFAVMSPTSRLALVTWHCTSSECFETTRQREARGTGALAQIGVSCACWGIKVLFIGPRRHSIRATDSGQKGALFGYSRDAG